MKRVRKPHLWSDFRSDTASALWEDVVLVTADGRCHRIRYLCGYDTHPFRVVLCEAWSRRRTALWLSRRRGKRPFLPALHSVPELLRSLCVARYEYPPC